MSAPGQDHATQDDLAAYAVSEGLVDASVAEHIAACARCSDDVARYHQLEALLYRVECPALPELEGHLLGTLAGERMAEVERHIQDCPRCESDLAVLRAVLPMPSVAPAQNAAPADTPAALGARETLRRVLAALLPPPAAPSFALRGEVETYRAEDIEVTLGHDVDRGKFSLYGKILHRGASDGGQETEPPLAISARLLKIADPQTPPKLVAETPIQQQYFEFTGLFPGHYQIELLLPDRLIVIASLVL
jgi:hypothetical protein